MIEFEAIIDKIKVPVRAKDVTAIYNYEKINKWYVAVQKENDEIKTYQVDREEFYKIIECDRLNIIWKNEESWKKENKGKDKLFSTREKKEHIEDDKR